MTFGENDALHSHDGIAICPISDVYDWGTTLVVATRPDMGFMGCGGAIAMLRQMGYRVHVLFICDSFINDYTSYNLPVKCLQDLRKYEVENALSKLGVSDESITFLDIKDELVPAQGEEGFDEIVGLCKNKLNRFIPDTILIPWRFAHYKDHLTIRKIVQKAVKQECHSSNIIEYALQPWIAEAQLKKLSESEALLWKLDNKPVLEIKLEAISQYHVEDIGIFQDELPTLTALNDEKLSYLTHPWEIYMPAQDK